MGTEKNTVGSRVAAARQAKQLSQTELARRIGVTPQSIQALEAGKIAKPKFIIELAYTLGVDANFLTGSQSLPKLMVPIVGIASAGTSNISRDEAGGVLGEVEAPEGATSSTVAVEVRGDSMGGRLENGDLVFYDDRRTPPTADLIGRLCVCETADGQVLIKKLAKGSRPNTYHLISYNAEPLFDQVLIWAARVLSIRPA